MTDPIRDRLLEGDLLARIYRSVELAYPEEGCGFVFEEADGALRLVPTVNRATQLHRIDPDAYPRDGRDYFEPDMKPWLRAVREGLEPRVIFHSHPDGDAYFSETDRGSAIFTDEAGGVQERNPGVVHLVVAVEGPNPTARVARLYAFSPDAGDFARIDTYDEAGRRLHEV